MLLEIDDRNKHNQMVRLKILLYVCQTLESCGWDVLESRAGFSVVAKPTLYLNKTIKLKNAVDYEAKLDDSNIRGAILKATGLCINSSSWTGIPGYCRFTIALEESEFQKALDCISEFKRIACS